MEEDEELDSVYDDQDIMKPRTYPRMKKRMKQIVQYIEMQLGYPVVQIELTPEQIKVIVDQAFQEIVHYMTDTYTFSVPYAQCIDLSKYNVDNVESVLRGQDSLLTGLPFQMPAMDLMNVTGTYNLDQYIDALLIKRNLNILATDMDFVWDKPNKKLYIAANPNVPSYVTIVFKPEYFEVEDIREQYWDTQLRKLALGMTKMAIGQIRSKYSSNSSKFQLNGAELLAEGQSEIQTVRQHLDDNKDIFTVLN